MYKIKRFFAQHGKKLLIIGLIVGLLIWLYKKFISKTSATATILDGPKPPKDQQLPTGLPAYLFQPKPTVVTSNYGLNTANGYTSVYNPRTRTTSYVPVTAGNVMKATISNN